jgi:hypothetical protein
LLSPPQIHLFLPYVSVIAFWRNALMKAVELGVPTPLAAMIAELDSSMLVAPPMGVEAPENVM